GRDGAVHGDRRRAAQAGDRDGRRGVGRRAVAEFAVVVPAPALDGAAREQRTGRLSAPHGDRRRAAQAGDRDGRRGVGRRAVAEFAVVVVAPALDGAAREQRTGRVGAHGDRRRAAKAGDRDGRRRAVAPTSGRRAVAEFALLVVAPALDGAARKQRTGRVGAHGDGNNRARGAAAGRGAATRRAGRSAAAGRGAATRRTGPAGG